MKPLEETESYKRLVEYELRCNGAGRSSWVENRRHYIVEKVVLYDDHLNWLDRVPYLVQEKTVASLTDATHRQAKRWFEQFKNHRGFEHCK